MLRRRPTEQEERDARRLQEFFAGRLNSVEALVLIQEHDGNFMNAADFVWRGDPARVRRFLNRDEEVIRQLQRETQIVGNRLNSDWQPAFQVRQFACQPCDSMWWRKVPTRKKVSKCHRCQQRYDAVPRSEEYGLGEFHCRTCGNVFRGFGWMEKTVSPCYRCYRQGAALYDPRHPPPAPGAQQQIGFDPGRGGGQGRGRGRGQGRGRGRGAQGAGRGGGGLDHPVPPQNGALGPGLCMPVRIFPPSEIGERRPRRTVDTHSCNAPNCWNQLMGVPPHVRAECVHPRVRPRQAMFPSRRHVSTGSTVDTWMTQDDLRAAWSMASISLEDIDEEGDDDNDNDDDDNDNDDDDNDNDDDDNDGSDGS